MPLTRLGSGIARDAESGGTMITIGIRAAPKVITFAIYDTDDDSILNVEEIKIPAAFETPAC